MNTPGSVSKHIRTLLWELGDTEEAVASKLREEGCRGKLGSFCECPVARYLKRHVPDYRVGVEKSVCSIYMNTYPPVRIEVPYPVQAFIGRFDNEWYPDLEQL